MCLIVPVIDGRSHKARQSVFAVESIFPIHTICHHCDTEFDKEWFHVPKEKYDRVRQYGRSKLGNIWFANELQRRYGAEYGIVATSLHPGNRKGGAALSLETRLW